MADPPLGFLQYIADCVFRGGYMTCPPLTIHIFSLTSLVANKLLESGRMSASVASVSHAQCLNCNIIKTMRAVLRNDIGYDHLIFKAHWLRAAASNLLSSLPHNANKWDAFISEGLQCSHCKGMHSSILLGGQQMQCVPPVSSKKRAHVMCTLWHSRIVESSEAEIYLVN